MQGMNLSAYYDKISTIRAKILTKHRQQPPQTAQNYVKENNSPTSSQKYCLRRPIQDQDTRVPLQQQSLNQRNISERLKELDLVNEKIKIMLANKRQPSVNAHQRQAPIYKNRNIQETPKNLTSKIQKQNEIVESKVGLSTHNWASSKQKLVQQKSYKTNTIKNTVESKLFNNERILRYQLQMEKTIVNKVQDLKEEKYTKQQTFNLRSDRYKLDIFEKRKGFTFADKDTQNLEDNKKSTAQYAQQCKNSTSVNLFYEKQQSQTKTLVQLLSNQIAHDAKLRELKQDFNHFKAQNKWSKLKEHISKYNSQVKDSELQRWITLSAEQSNPFNQKINQNNFDYSQLAACFFKAWNHWNKQLKGSVSIDRLEKQGFKIQEIDLGGKGYITIEDLVCFINLHSDSCLRNRDVFALFKRWNQCNKGQKVQNKLKYQTFLHFVAH